MHSWSERNLNQAFSSQLKLLCLEKWPSWHSRALHRNPRRQYLAIMNMVFTHPCGFNLTIGWICKDRESSRCLQSTDEKPSFSGFSTPVNITAHATLVLLLRGQEDTCPHLPPYHHHHHHHRGHVHAAQPCMRQPHSPTVTSSENHAPLAYRGNVSTRERHTYRHRNRWTHKRWTEEENEKDRRQGGKETGCHQKKGGTSLQWWEGLSAAKLKTHITKWPDLTVKASGGILSQIKLNPSVWTVFLVSNDKIIF